VNPDILGNVMDALSNENDGKCKNESAKLLKKIMKFGRKFDINSAYDSFIKDKDENKMEENELNLPFFYSLNELKFLGIINSMQKSSLIFNKNIFAKTFFNDYSQKNAKK
jgi:hypothetical protein